MKPAESTYRRVRGQTVGKKMRALSILPMAAADRLHSRPRLLLCPDAGWRLAQAADTPGGIDAGRPRF